MPYKDPAKKYQWQQEWLKKHPEYVKKWRRTYYLKNTEKLKEKVKQQKLVRKEWFENYKKTLSCCVCGENDSRCLIFHHKDPKKKRFDLATQAQYGRKSVLKEIAKCDVLCANCHMKLHYETNGLKMTKSA